MGRLPAAMPHTIRAAEHLLRSRPSDTRGQAADLLLALAAIECHASGRGRQVVQTPVELLRDLVILTARLAGRAWMDANTDRAADFTRLLDSRQPPPLPCLDQILARLLSDRFGLAAPAAL